ncbi:MAG: large-conductance mechanosensitive channel protein MscL [Pseudomonadota bacterium]
MGMLTEFKTFALKSNFLDMATGIVIGGAVGTVVQSLVKDIIMPPVGLLLGGVDFSALSIPLKAATADEAAVAINYGSFINNLISFIIVMFAIFMIIKAYNRMKEQMENEPKEEAPAAPPRQEVLLEEIRDALRTRS